MADPTAEPDGKLVYTIADLADEGYMDPPIDPQKKGTPCTGTVTITKAATTSGIDSYNYEVTLNCSGKSETKTFKTED